MRNTHPLKLIPFIIIGLLLLAIVNLPYGYYTFLRIIVFIYIGILAYQYLIDGKYSRWLIFATIGIIYNPIFSIHLTKSIRIVINLIVVAIIVIYLIVKQKCDKKFQKACDEAWEYEQKVEEFFKNNPKAQKELEDEVESWQTKSRKPNPNVKIVRCGVPYIWKAREKIYEKFNS